MRLTLAEKQAAIREIAGAWGPGESGADFVDRIRPGVAARLARKLGDA